MHHGRLSIVGCRSLHYTSQQKNSRKYIITRNQLASRQRETITQHHLKNTSHLSSTGFSEEISSQVNKLESSQTQQRKTDKRKTVKWFSKEEHAS